LGSLVPGAGFTVNNLIQLDPLYVTFNPSESDLPAIEAARGAGEANAEVTLPGDASQKYSGDLTFIDNSVDPATGTITAWATVHNATYSLLPGQFVHIRVHVRATSPTRCSCRKTRSDRTSLANSFMSWARIPKLNRSSSRWGRPMAISSV
jgi:hypothetical protein